MNSTSSNNLKKSKSNNLKKSKLNDAPNSEVFINELAEPQILRLDAILDKYFTYPDENREVKYYLPLSWTSSINSLSGGMPNLTEKEYKELSNLGQVERPNGVFRLICPYTNAQYFEVSLWNSQECIIILDIDNIENLEEYNSLSIDEKLIYIQNNNFNFPNWIANLPFTLSRNKQLPHYWMRLDNIHKKYIRDNGVKSNLVGHLFLTNKKKSNGDILIVNTWERSDSKLYNYNGEIPLIDFQILSSVLDDKAKDKIDIQLIDDQPQKIDYVDSDSEDEDEELNEQEMKELKNLKKSNKRKQEDLNNMTQTQEVENNFSKLNNLLKCYKPDWMAEYNNWFKFTVAFKVYFGNNLYPTFDAICQKFPGYDSKDNYRIWTSLNITKEEKKSGFYNLMKWGKEQNPELYAQLFPRTGMNIDWSRLDEAYFADLYYKRNFMTKDNQNKLIFVMDDDNSKLPNGYIYNNVYWKNIGTNLGLIRGKKFDLLYNDCISALLESKESGEMDLTTFKALQKKLGRLNENRVRKNISEMIRDNYMESKINWNQNNNLFVFNNKIYDLEQGQFIEPRPDQYINITCGYDYIECNDLNVENEINRFIDSILHTDNIATEKPYLMKVLASFLRQCNKEEKAYFFTGIGRNGKGTLTTLLNNILGDYWGELNIENYTEYDNGANSQKQNLYNCRYARVLNTSEIAELNKFGKKLTFIEDNFKRLTGGDTIVARKCGVADTAKFKPGKILIQTNTLPKFSKMSVSLKERIVVMNFPYTFTDNEQLLNLDPTIYKRIDRTLKEKFNTTLYKNAFIQMLFKSYKNYLLEGLALPESVKQYTNSYFIDSSQFIKWFYANYKMPYEGLTEKDIKQQNDKYKRIDLVQIVNEYNASEKDAADNMTVKKLIEKFESEIPGFKKEYIKKGKSNFELMKWIPIPEDEKDPEMCNQNGNTLLEDEIEL